MNTAQSKPEIRVVLVSAAGDNFSAGNDLQDFLDHPPGSGDSPQKQLIDALSVLDKPLVGAVRGAAVGSGATMLTYFDFVYASQNARFQYPFINLALVPEFGTSASKQLLRRQFRSRVEQGTQDELVEFSERVRSADAREALTAFFEKRPPRFNSSETA